MANMFFALEWSGIGLGIFVVILLAAVLWIPYLIKEIRDGKGELGPLWRFQRGKITVGPMTPTGAGDNHPGRRGDPAPGQPDGQADPYGADAQRNAPEVRS